MIDGLMLVLVVVTALGCGLMSGTLFAFSAFVMSGLKRLPPDQGITAMQSINVTAVTPPFMTAFFGTTVLCIAAAVGTIVDWKDTASVYVLVGAGLYVFGVFVMTAAYHVPRNNRLAEMNPATGEAAEYWSRYLSEWTRWNHVRALTSLLAAAALTVAVLVN
jgi:uncharacterized membrane protein